MVERMKKDRGQQNMVLKNMQDVLDLLNSIDDVFDNLVNEQSNVDKLISDYNHLVEEYDLSDDARLKISHKLSELYDRRKEIKNMLQIKLCWERNIEKLKQKDSRNMIRSYMNQTLSRLDNEYKARVMSEDDKNLLLSCETEKESPSKVEDDKEIKKRKRLSPEIKKQIFEKIDGGMNKSQVAKLFGVSYPTVYLMWKNRGKMEK